MNRSFVSNALTKVPTTFVVILALLLPAVLVTGIAEGRGPAAPEATSTVRDEFSSQLYTNNNGTVNWSAGWAETGTGETPTNPTGGNIQVVTDTGNSQSNYQLRVQGDGSGVLTVGRGATLTGATIATLTFRYRRDGLDAGDSVIVAASSGGSNGVFTTIDTFAGAATDSTYTSVSYDITSYISANTYIRFSTNGASMATSDRVWFDDIQIEYFSPTAGANTIDGYAFHDYNADGVRQTTNAFYEPVLPGVVVTAYSATGTVYGPVQTGASGVWSLSVPNTTQVRVEFTLPSSLTYLQPGAAGKTTVQFVTSPATNVNIGYNDPSDYSQANPDLITPRTAFGPRSNLSAFVPGQAAQQANESIIGIGYDANGPLENTSQHQTYATLSQTGTLYGMIYQRKSKLILAGTYLKSYADTGPKLTGQTGNYAWLNDVDPLGAIYGVKVLGGTPNPNTNPAKVYANLNKIMDPSVSQPSTCPSNPATCIYISGNPAGTDPRRDPLWTVPTDGRYNYDNGTLGDCNGTGTNGAPASGQTCWWHDPAAFDLVGSIGLGDLEEDSAELFVFAVNLKDKRLYQLPIEPDDTKWPVQTLAATPVSIPDTCGTAGPAVPGGLGFHNGRLYVGVTCTAKTSQNANLLKAEVWEFNPSTQAFGASPVFTMLLNYPRGCIFANNPSDNAPKNVGTPLQNCQTYIDGSENTIDNAKWVPWPQTWQQMFENNKGINSPGKAGWTTSNSVRLEYPHPWLSDISFDGDDLQLGFRDIGGDRTGNVVRSPKVDTAAGFPTTGTPAASWMSTYTYDYYGAGFGDLLRACWSGSGWSLENNGTCGGVTSLGANNGQGPSTAGTYPPAPAVRTGFTGYGEFYWDDSGPGSRNPAQTTYGFSGANYQGHEQTIMGGIFQQSGQPDIAVTISDQFGYGDGGIARFSSVADHPNISLETNCNLLVSGYGTILTYPTTLGNSACGGDESEAGLALRHTRLYDSTEIKPPGFFGKANGLGDMEALLEPAPIEIGNRVWRDTTVNGRQDPGELPIPNVVVGLWCGGRQIGQTTTDANGEYYFGGINFRGLTAPPTTSTRAIVAATDDAEENVSTGAVTTGDTTLDMPYTGTTLQLVGVRFQNLTIPRGATITDAKIQFTSAALDSTTVNLTIKGQAADNAAAFSATANNISSRSTTTSSVAWSDVPAWSAGESGADTTTPTTLANVVQEIVNRSGWASGNAMAFIISNNGSASGNQRQAASFDNTTYTEAQLVVTYELPIPFDTACQIRIDRTQTALTSVGYTVPTWANQDQDQRDSDGVDISVANNVGVNFTTGGPGMNNHTYDFGFIQEETLVNLGDRVWLDANNNGLQDTGEAGINGVTVNLYADTNGDGVLTPGQDSFIATTTTANVLGIDGIYNFTGLLPGDYIVHLPQSNFTGAGKLVGLASSTGNNPAPDPDNNLANDDNGYHLPGNGVASLAVTLLHLTEPGPPDTDTNPTVDFGFFGLGAIGNYVWVDENSDGYQDAGEPGIPNVHVQLKNCQSGAVLADTYTDSHGGYLFDNLQPGTYCVQVVGASLPAGLSQTTIYPNPNADFGNQNQSGNGYSVTIGGTQPLENLTADFGYNYNPTGDVNSPPSNPGGNPSTAVVAALGDRVWIDSDGLGDQNPSEIGVRGVTVQIFTAGPDGLFGTGDDVGGATQVTDANGYYLFDNLAPGAYVVKVVNSATASHDVLNTGLYSQTGDPDHFGIPNPNTSNPGNADNATTAPVILGPGDVFLNADFGYKPGTGTTLGSIGDTVWFDADADGTGPSLAPVDGGTPVIQGNGTAPADASEKGIPGVSVALIRDSNGDGRWDAGEPIIATTTTNANGQYLFKSLPITDGAGSDDYLVWVNDTDNVLGEMVPTYDKDGAALPALPSLRIGLGISAVTNLGTTGGSPYNTNDARDQDFGYTNTYQQAGLGLIGDYVWLDADRQNDQDEIGAGIEGVLVELLNSTGTTVLATTTTDENGWYSFGGLPLNTSYIVRIAGSNFNAGSPLYGMTNTGGPTGGSGDAGPVVNLTSASPVNLVQDFGYAAPTTTGSSGTVGNLVWLDSNADGVFTTVNGPDGLPGTDDDEPVAGNVTVDLYRDLNCNSTVDAGEPRISTMATAAAINAGLYGADGNYRFGALPTAGATTGTCTSGQAAYVVNVTDVNGVLSGYWHSLGTAGINNNSQVDPYAVQISSAAPDNLRADFGYYVQPAALGNYVWLDDQAGANATDGNGLQDSGEPGIDNVRVTITIAYPDGTSVSLVTTTGNDLSTTGTTEVGWYGFGNLLLDEDYRIGSNTGAAQANRPAHKIAVVTGQAVLSALAPTKTGGADGDDQAGADQKTDSNYHTGTIAVPTQGLTDVTQQAVASNEQMIASYDFGFVPVGAIGNFVWVDENSDGYQDAGEPGIPNVRIYLKNCTSGAVLATTYTDAHGGYLFDSLTAGTYCVDVDETTLPPGMTQSPFNLQGADFGNQNQSGNGYSVTIGGAQPPENLTADFGYNYNPPTDVDNGTGVAAVGDRIWIDANGNGAQEPEEVGVPNVCLELWGAGPDGIFNPGPDGRYGTGDLGDDSVKAAADATTNSTGYYLFDGLAPGAYVVQVCASSLGAGGPLNGYTQTGDADHFGTTGTNNDNMTTTPVVLAPGDVFLNADFGYQPATCGRIGDTIWFDADADGSGPALAPVIGGSPVNQGNGVQNDSLEWTIPGVTVALIRDGNQNGMWDATEPIIGTAVTNGNGQYLFPCLSIADGTGTDDYIVWVNDTDNVLGGLKPTYDKDGGAATLSPSAPTGSNTNTVLGISAVANLDGTPVMDQDFGYTAPGQQPSPAAARGLIGDTVWFDINNSGGNQSTQGSEPGIEGVVMELLGPGADGISCTADDQLMASTATDENGHYAFGELSLDDGVGVAGADYCTRVAASNFASGGVLYGMAETYAAGGTLGGHQGNLVTLTTASPVNLAQDFSYTVQTDAGAVGNLVWLDVNADGVYPPGLENPIGSVTVDLYRDLNCNGTVDAGEPRISTIAVGTAAAINAALYGTDGNYRFGSLPTVGATTGTCTAGQAAYVVNVTDLKGVLSGYWHSLGALGLNNNSQSDPYAVKISAGSPSNLTADFGYYVKPACLGNYVWLDDQPGNNGTDNDGIQNSGEPAIDNVLVTLTAKYVNSVSYAMITKSGDNPWTSGTTEHGWYGFCNLLLDEDNASSKTGSPTASQPVYTISAGTPPGCVDCVPTKLLQGPDRMVDSDSPAGVDGLTSEGLTDVTQNASPGLESSPNAGYDFGFYQTTPTSVLLDVFEARWLEDGTAKVIWTTLDESGFGAKRFNLYRSASPDGDGTLVFSTPSTALPGDGATYEYIDTEVQPNTTVFYRLEVVRTDDETESLMTIMLGPGGNWVYLPLLTRDSQ